MYKTLDSSEIIRQRPGMFVGDTYSPDHLVEEILDNSLDEVMNGFATKIHLYFDSKENMVWCLDNGRGISVYDMRLQDGSIQDSVEVLCTKLFSGSKFDNLDYEQLIGMHGVGLVAVNALSDNLIVKTRDRKQKNKIYIYTFEDSKLISKEISEDKNYNDWSTIVGFKPSKKYFETIEINQKQFVERLMFVQSLYNIDVEINYKKIQKLNFEEYVKQKLNTTNLSYLALKNKKSSIQIYINYEEDDDQIIIGNVNLRFCEGKFITSFTNELKKSISSKLDKKFEKIPDRDLLNGLRAFIIVFVPEPRFDAQIKSRMILDLKNSLIDPLKNQIDSFVSKKINIIQSNLERKFYQKIVSNPKRNSVKLVSIDKLRDCKIIPGEVLYILEGDSADGTLKQIRNQETEAVFPLKGKVINVEVASLEKIKNNKEIKNLLEALGPINNRRYKKIKILADADSDGKHITVLILLLLLKFAPDYIKNESTYVLIPPLYGAEKGGKYIPIYDLDLIPKFKEKNYNITRFKGLGEMDPDQLEVCIRSNFEYKVTWPEDPKIIDLLLSLITNSEAKRQILNSEKMTSDLILNELLKKGGKKNGSI